MAYDEKRHETDPYKGTPLEGESADEIFIDRLLQIARGGMSMDSALFLLAAAQKEREINRKRKGAADE